MINFSRRGFVLCALGILSSLGINPVFAARHGIAKNNPKQNKPSGPTAALNAKGKPIKVGSIPIGESIDAHYQLDSSKAATPVVVHRIGVKTFAAFSAICTHNGCTIAATAKTFNCPCHGSVYDSASGKVVIGPALLPLKRVKVAITKGLLTFVI